ncbi:UACA [Symbiodinium sp. CCMP2592]|nr:UACA [Symbiodinium sp. CCMP2592]
MSSDDAAAHAAAFLAAAEKGMLEVARRHLQGRHRRMIVSSADGHGRGAVHLAARAGHSEMIALLHDHGLLLEDCDAEGRTPLHLASEHGRMEAAMVLLDRGCAADVQDTAGRTALHLAVCSKEPRLCNLLQAKSPELASRKDLQGRSPLSYAVLHPAQPVAEQCTRLLLAGLADVNAEDIFGFDALHYARKAGAEGAAALLKAVQSPAQSETVPQRLQHVQDDIPYWNMLLDQREPGALPKLSATQGAGYESQDEYHSRRSVREEAAHAQHAHAHAERLRQELLDQSELLEAAKLEIKEGQLREKELRTELVVQQNATTGADQEAYGEGFPNSLGHRVLRAGRQLAQKSEEFRTAEAAARSLAGRNSDLEAELQASKDLVAEIQVEELELHRKLDRELQNRGEEESWRFLAEEDRCSAAAVREMLEQRLEEAEKSAASFRLREIDSLSKLEGDLAQLHEAEMAQMRREFETAKEEAGTSWNSIATVRAEAKRNVEAEAEICRHELQSARLAQEKQRQLEQQLHQGRQLSSFLEQEASRLKEEVRVRDEQWQALFRSTSSLSLGREALLSSHREEMKEIFDLLDADGSGSIDPKASRMKVRARSALQDERVGALFSAIASAPRTREPPPPPDVDWPGFYGRNGRSGGRNGGGRSFVGPVEARQLPGRGIGLVTSRQVRAGELLLLEDAWATSTTKGAASNVAIAELAEACVKKLGTAGEMERALFWCLHGTSEEGWQNPSLRLKIFEQHLHRLGQDNTVAGYEEGPGPSLPAWPRQLQSAVSAIVASNSRRSEAWNALTLLLDETQALGGLWLVASLFNHSCCANVTLSYSLSEDRVGGSSRVYLSCYGLPTCARTVACQGGITLELVDTYVYPFDTVVERRSRLQRTYGFLCTCTRCSVEAPLAAEAGKVADLLEAELQTFSTLRGRRAKPSEVGEVVRKIRQVLDRVFATAQKLPPSTQPLWRAQFVWGLHGLAMAAQDAGFFQEAVDAFQTCIELAALIAPSSEYELKYHMMLVQCMARRTLSSPPSALPDDTPASMKEALRRAEEAHNRHYGGGGRHFLSRMQKRLEDFYAALRRCGKR